MNAINYFNIFHRFAGLCVCVCLCKHYSCEIRISLLRLRTFREHNIALQLNGFCMYLYIVESFNIYERISMFICTKFSSSNFLVDLYGASSALEDDVRLSF